MTTLMAKFDYGDMAETEYSKLDRLAEYVRKERAAHAIAIVKIGQHLADANAILAGKGSEGLFRPWVEACCGFSKSTAYNYMAAFSVWDKELKRPSLGHFDVEALYALGKDTTPEDAAKEVSKLANKGEHITVKLAKEIIAKHNGTTPAKPKKTKPAPAAADPEPEEVEEGAEPEAEPELETIEEVADENGEILPAELVDAFTTGQEFETLARELTSIDQRAKKLADSPAGAHFHLQSFQSDIANAKRNLRQAMPSCICPYCEGTMKYKKQECKACRKIGLVPKHAYKAAPAEMRA